MNSFLDKLLKSFSLSYEDYLTLTKNVSYDSLEDPYLFKNILKASERIKKAIENKEKIMIYGDYDCDGICATSIMYLTLKELGVIPGYYIPSRYKDGYGINENMVSLIHSKGYSLIITVDNGVSQFEALKKAKELGIDVILTDHHKLNETIPECYTIVHPSLKEEPFNQCGAYVAFMLSRVLLNRIDDYLLSLGALATISDMMPLVSYNRDLVRLSILICKKNNYPSFNMLLGDSSFENEKSFSFSIAPKINALGRVSIDTKVNKVVSFLTSSSSEERRQVGALILEACEKRKNLTEEAFKKCNTLDALKDNVIILNIDVCEGVIGLVAQKVLKETSKPCIIFTHVENKDVLKGSARSLEGFDIAEAFNALDDLLLTHGGHASAGGLSLKEENLSLFKERINKLCEGKTLHEKAKRIIPLNKDEFSLENYKLLSSLSPFGEGFEEPYFSYQCDVNDLGYITNGKHIKGKINENSEYVGFNLGSTTIKGKYVTLIGKLDLNNFRGVTKLNLKVEEMEFSDALHY